MKLRIRKIELSAGYIVDVEISEDPKREGMLIGRYRDNCRRTLFGKKWQEKLRTAINR